MARKTFTVGLAASVAALLLACGMGSAKENDSSKLPTNPSGGAATVHGSGSAPGKAAPTKAAAATIPDGAWTAGTDFPLGTYETTTTADLCLWEVTTGEGDSKHYVEQKVGAGHHKWTFKNGQHLDTHDCGTWTRTK